jgi:hypothetical protein
MTSRWGPLVNPFIPMAIAIVGIVDASIGGSSDLVVLFALLFVLSAALTTRVLGNRRWFRLRGDLAQWLEARAAESGETAENLVDRAVAAYRAGLSAGWLESRR